MNNILENDTGLFCRKRNTIVFALLIYISNDEGLKKGSDDGKKGSEEQNMKTY